jgi:hypothetical protein
MCGEITEKATSQFGHIMQYKSNCGISVERALLIPIPRNPELDWPGGDILMQLAQEIPLEGELPFLFH